LKFHIRSLIGIVIDIYNRLRRPQVRILDIIKVYHQREVKLAIKEVIDHQIYLASLPPPAPVDDPVSIFASVVGEIKFQRSQEYYVKFVEDLRKSKRSVFLTLYENYYHSVESG